MTKKLPLFVKLPSAWIEAGGLADFRWKAGGSDETAALMVLMVIAHHVDPIEGIARLTYDELVNMTGISRAKVSAGLGILETRRILERLPQGRSSYKLAGYNPTFGWAKFPVRGLYKFGSVAAFVDFKLRRPAELDALKLYFLFAARRSRELNMAPISYEKIEEYSGVREAKIRSALSVLTTHDLVHVERFTSRKSESGIAHAYRLTHLEAHHHLGTVGRDHDFDLGLVVSDLQY